MVYINYTEESLSKPKINVARKLHPTRATPIYQSSLYPLRMIISEFINQIKSSKNSRKFFLFTSEGILLLSFLDPPQSKSGSRTSFQSSIRTTRFERGILSFDNLPFCQHLDDIILVDLIDLFNFLSIMKTDIILFSTPSNSGWRVGLMIRSAGVTRWAYCIAYFTNSSMSMTHRGVDFYVEVKAVPEFFLSFLFPCFCHFVRLQFGPLSHVPVTLFQKSQIKL